jgi:predicted N-acetyltransferase YhbS
MKDECNWEEGWYEEGDKTTILAINQAEYGDVALSQESYFDWVYGKNSLGPPIIPVARDKGTDKVVGFAMFIPMRVSWAGEERRALLGYNMVVDPAYRRQGIQTKVSAVGPELGKKQGYDFFYAFPNPTSLLGLIKSKYHVVSQIPMIIRPLDIAALTETHVGKPLMRWGVNLGWEVARRTLCRERCPSQNGLPMRIVEDTTLDESYDRFWDHVKTKYNLMLVRDRAFLQWRFRDIPIRKYQILSARHSGQILGYVVLSQADIRGTMVGLIADFMVLPGEHGEQAGSRLLQEALQRFKAAQLLLTGGLMLPHTQEYALLQRAGYLRVPQRLAPQPFHLVLKSISGGIPSSVLTRPEAWYVSIADHDAV